MSARAARARFDAALVELREAAVAVLEEMPAASPSDREVLVVDAGAAVEDAWEQAMTTTEGGDWVSRLSLEAERDMRDREIDYLRSR